MRGDLGPTPFTRGVAEGSSPCVLRAWKKVPTLGWALTFLCAVQRVSSPRTARAVQNGVAEHPLFWTQAEFS